MYHVQDMDDAANAAPHLSCLGAQNAARFCAAPSSRKLEGCELPDVNGAPSKPESAVEDSFAAKSGEATKVAGDSGKLRGRTFEDDARSLGKPDRSIPALKKVETAAWWLFLKKWQLLQRRR